MNKWTCLFLCTDEDWCFQSINLYLITPRLDNLLLKTFEVAVKVPNFSFCCLMFIFFQMWFQLHSLVEQWHDSFNFVRKQGPNDAVQFSMCATDQTGGMVDHCAVHVCPHHYQLSPLLHCLLKSRITGVKSTSKYLSSDLQIVSSFFSLGMFISKYRTWPLNSDQTHNLTYCCSFCTVSPCWH